MKRCARSLCWIVVLAIAISYPVSRADDSTPDKGFSDADRAAVRSVIESQIDAFRHDDGPRAFSYAAPAIRELFGSPDRFMLMVKQRYRPVYRPLDVKFGDLLLVAGEATQHVLLVDPDGIAVLALYMMERQDDGSWKVLGCLLMPVERYMT